MSTNMKEKRKRSFLDKMILVVVILIALVVIALSFSNTTKLAIELGLDPYLTAGLVEILFASLLFIRGRQRATQRNVPFFLNAGYFSSFLFVTGVNVWGLSQESPFIGAIVGVSVSGAMWLMESVLVWLWVDSHRPHKKKMKELKREAKKQIEEIKLRQQIDWMLWEAKKPDMALIEKARKVEEKRKSITKKGIPEFFRQDQPEKDQSNQSEENRSITIYSGDYQQSIIDLFIKAIKINAVNRSNHLSTYNYSMMIEPLVHAFIQAIRNQSINHSNQETTNHDQPIIIDQSPINQPDKQPIDHDQPIIIDQSPINQPDKQPIDHDQPIIIDQSPINQPDKQPINQSSINQSPINQPDKQSIDHDQSILVDHRSIDQSITNQSSADQSTKDYPINQSGDSQSIDHESTNQDQSGDQGEEITFNQEPNNQHSTNTINQIDQGEHEGQLIDHEEEVKSIITNFDEDLNTRYPIQAVAEYYCRFRKLPSYRKAMKLGNCSYYKASEAVKLLKAHIEKNKDKVA